jgi:hypothetical protein
VDKLTQGFRTKEWELSKAADGELQALLDERKDLLSKRAHTLSLCPQGPTTTTSAPLFWLKALRASAGCGVVAARDEWALASLGDVRVRWDWSHVPTPEEPWRKCTGRSTLSTPLCHSLHNVLLGLMWVQCQLG